jgi:hypothetical protein
MEQVAPAATLVPQVLVWENEVGFVPAMEIPWPDPLRVRAAVPVFLSEIAWVAAEEPTVVLANVRVAGVRVTAGAVPVPVRDAVCGEPLALSATLTVAFSDPAAAGLKVTVILQLAPAATLVPQVFVCENDVGFVPAMEMPCPAPFRLSAPVPVFLSVMAWVAAEEPTAVLANVNVAGVRLTAGAGATPVPESAAVCGEPLALSATLTVAESAPVAAGLKVTVMLQLDPAATLVPQVLVWENDVGFVPAMLMPCPVPFRLSAPVPVFLSEMAWVAAEEPTVVLAKVRVAGVRLTAGAVPVPVRDAVCGEPLALSATLTVAFSDPAAAGLKVTVMLQLAPAATLVPQVLVCENDVGFVPVMLMPCPVPFNVRAAFPVFLSAMAWVAAEDPTAVLANVRVAGVRLTAGAEAVAAATDCPKTTARATGTNTVNHRETALMLCI